MHRGPDFYCLSGVELLTPSLQLSRPLSNSPALFPIPPSLFYASTGGRLREELVAPNGSPGLGQGLVDERSSGAVGPPLLLEGELAARRVRLAEEARSATGRVFG